MGSVPKYGLVFAVCLASLAMLANNSGGLVQSMEGRLAVDGAFRDGLYVGKLAAKYGYPLRPPIGRWSTGEERSMFTAGYRRGYGDVLASAAAASTAE